MGGPSPEHVGFAPCDAFSASCGLEVTEYPENCVFLSGDSPDQRKEKCLPEGTWAHRANMQRCTSVPLVSTGEIVWKGGCEGNALESRHRACSEGIAGTGRVQPSARFIRKELGALLMLAGSGNREEDQ